MHITNSALRMIEILSPDAPFKIEVHGTMVNGFHVDLVSNASQSQFDVTINSEPLIIADLASVSYLTGSTIDLIDNEFVIRNT